MRRGTIFPILFVLIVAAIFGASYIVQETEPEPPPPTPLPGPITLDVAVHPLALDWTEAAAQAFNATTTVNDRPVTITVIEAPDDMEIWQNTVWTLSEHPDMWIPATTLGLNFVAEQLPVEGVTPSLARTPLVWMGYSSRVEALTEAGVTAFDWPRVAEVAALESWGAVADRFSATDFVNLGYMPPDTNVDGFAVVLSASAAFNETASPTYDQTRDAFFDWFNPVIAAQQTFIGSLEAYVARSATAHLNIAPESIWLTHLQDFLRNEDVVFSYPVHTFMFDFPLAIWDDANVNDDTRAVITAWSDWLLSPEPQSLLVDYGMRPASGDPIASASLFASGVPYGIEIAPDFSSVIAADFVTSDARALLNVYRQAQ